MGEPKIRDVRVRAFKVPTEEPEADGTLEWSSTTLVLVEIVAGDQRGLGFTYADVAAAKLIENTLAARLPGRTVLDLPAIRMDLERSIRNLGREGIAMTAISAVDNALWDLKARCLQVSLSTLLGQARPAIEIYGSGGFTSYSIDRLTSQLSGWVQQGWKSVKMKVGRSFAADLTRIEAARRAIGDDAALFIDANGGYSLAEAGMMAEECRRFHVSWFEEPVSSDDVSGLARIRERAPAPLEIAAGEYAYTTDDFLKLLQHGSVDVMQADVTRCGGVTGFLEAAALCQAFRVPLSSHCAPVLHLPLGCAVPHFRHAEYFLDHTRIESMLFEGVPVPHAGMLAPDLNRPGFGIELKEADARIYEERI